MIPWQFVAFLVLSRWEMGSHRCPWHGHRGGITLSSAQIKASLNLPPVIELGFIRRGFVWVGGRAGKSRKIMKYFFILS